MHPAKSVIFFTTASGAGYGLVFWLAVAAMFNIIPQEMIFGLIVFAVAFSLITGGLLSSTFHLGHPERAWRAMSQWRTSWLSREGVAAVVSFVPMGLFALLWIFGKGGGGVLLGIAAFFSAIMAIATVYCTAMIYASLKSIPAWYNSWTTAGYLLFALMTGAVLLAFAAAFAGYQGAGTIAIFAFILLVLGAAVKLLYWQSVASAPAVSTSGTATGLGRFGTVTLVESPHSDKNYLLEEMGFKVARKHAEKLRRIALVAAFAVPVMAILISLLVSTGLLKTGLLLIAVVACAIGIVVERWLFFAEARHVVTLYYGEQKI